MSLQMFLYHASFLVLETFLTPEALPLLSTAALNAPQPVILAPDSRSFVDNGARLSLVVGALLLSLCVQAAHPNCLF